MSHPHPAARSTLAMVRSRRASHSSAVDIIRPPLPSSYLRDERERRMNRLQKRNSRKRLEKTESGSGRTTTIIVCSPPQRHHLFQLTFSAPLPLPSGASPSSNSSGGRSRANSASAPKSRLPKSSAASAGKAAKAAKAPPVNSPLIPPHMHKGLQHLPPDQYHAAVAQVRLLGMGPRFFSRHGFFSPPSSLFLVSQGILKGVPSSSASGQRKLPTSASMRSTPLHPLHVPGTLFITLISLLPPISSRPFQQDSLEMSTRGPIRPGALCVRRQPTTPSWASTTRTPNSLSPC